MKETVSRNQQVLKRKIKKKLNLENLKNLNYLIKKKFISTTIPAMKVRPGPGKQGIDDGGQGLRQNGNFLSELGLRQLSNVATT